MLLEFCFQETPENLELKEKLLQLEEMVNASGGKRRSSVRNFQEVLPSSGKTKSIVCTNVSYALFCSSCSGITKIYRGMGLCSISKVRGTVILSSLCENNNAVFSVGN